MQSVETTFINRYRSKLRIGEDDDFKLDIPEMSFGYVRSREVGIHYGNAFELRVGENGVLETHPFDFRAFLLPFCFIAKKSCFLKISA